MFTTRNSNNNLRISVFVLLSFFSIGSVLGQNSNLRKSKKSQLAINESSTFGLNIPESKILINDSIIQIYPGEKLYIEAEIVKNQLKNLKVVDKISDKSKTLVIEFQQVVNGKSHKQMKLSIFNPFERNLKYVSNIYLSKFQTWTETSVIPVGSGKTSYEFWPDLISTITLSSFEFQK